MNLWTLTARTLGIDPNTTNAAEVEQIEEGVRNIQKEMIRTNLIPFVGLGFLTIVSLGLNAVQMFSTNSAIHDKITVVQSALNQRIDSNASADVANYAQLASKIEMVDTSIGNVASDLKKLNNSLPSGNDLDAVVAWYDQQDPDRDGFKGTYDWCPDIAGIKGRDNENGSSDYDGCPIGTDTDEDGVDDFRDRCPDTTEEDAKKHILGDGQSDYGWSSQFTAYDGCIDSDDDGVADLIDACPDSGDGGEGDFDAQGCDKAQVAAKTCKVTVSSTPDKGEGDVELATGKVVYGECTYYDSTTASIECDYTETGLTACALKG